MVERYLKYFWTNIRGFLGLVVSDENRFNDDFEAARRIHQMDKNLENVPIIAMTAHAMEDDRERWLEAGMNGYVSKPIAVRTFITKINQVIKMSKKYV